MRVADTIHSIARKIATTLRGKTHSAVPYGGLLSDVPSEERSRTAMHRAFYENIGGVVHKWRHYLDIYDRHLSRYCGKPVKILEIGVSKGGSMAMWRRYFGQDAKIFGIDINPECAHLGGTNAEVRIGSQADPAFLRSVIVEMGGVDVVIDDGSHIASHQRVSFEILFPLLDANGVYICEDTHTAYWRDFEGGYRRKSNFLEIVKKIVDDIHGDFHDHALSVKDANRIIKGIHFYNSMVVIEKVPQTRPTNIYVG